MSPKLECGSNELHRNALVILCNTSIIWIILRVSKYLHSHSMVGTPYGKSTVVDWCCCWCIMLNLFRTYGKDSPSRAGGAETPRVTFGNSQGLRSKAKSTNSKDNNNSCDKTASEYDNEDWRNYHRNRCCWVRCVKDSQRWISE